MSKEFWSIQVIISCAFSRVWSQEQEWRWKGEWRKSGEKCGFKLASRGDSIWRENCDSDAKLRRALIYFVVKPILVSHCVPWPPGALIRLFLWNWNSLGPGLDSLLRIHWFQTFTAASHFSFQSHHVARAGPGHWDQMLLPVWTLNTEHWTPQLGPNTITTCSRIYSLRGQASSIDINLGWWVY